MDQAANEYKQASARLAFDSNGILQGGIESLPVVLGVPQPDGIFIPVRGVMRFADGFLSAITVNDTDWGPSRTGPLGPLVLHVFSSIRAKSADVAEGDAVKLYVAEGRVIKHVPLGTVPVSAKAIQQFPQF